MNNLKISNFGKKVIGTVVVAASLIIPLSSHANAATPAEPIETVITTTNDSTTTTTTEVSYAGEEVFDNEQDALNQAQDYYDTQEDIKKDVEANGGSYNYDLNMEEQEKVNEDIVINTDAITPEEVDKVVDDATSKLPSNVEVTEVTSTPVTEPKEETIEEAFDTEKEAEERQEDINDEITAKGGSVTKSDITESYVDSTTTTDTNAYAGLTEEEANKLKSNLEASDGNEHDFAISVAIKAYQVDTGKDDILNLSKTFNTPEEAQTYLDSLIAQGYTIASSSITLNTHDETRIFSHEYDTLEEANQALEDFKEMYNNVSGTVTEKRDETEDTNTKTQGTTKYETEQEAQNVADSLEQENHDIKVVATVIKEIESGVIENIVTQSFETEAEVISYLETLKNQGYTIKDYTITKQEVSYIPVLPEIDNGSTTEPITNNNRANMFIRIDGNVQYENGKTGYNNNYYVYAGSVGTSGNIVYDPNANNQNDNLVYLINNNNEIADEIVAAISQQEIKNILSQYGINLTNDQVIVWYVLKDQVDATVNDRQYIDNAGNSVYVDLPSCRYHIDGVIRNKSQIENIYIVTGNLEKDVFYVDEVTTNKGYDYEVKAEGTETVSSETYQLEGEAHKDVYDTQYALDVTKEAKNYVYTLKVTGLYDEVVGNVITIKSKTKTYKVATNGDGSYSVVVSNEKDPNHDIPITGDDNNIALYSSLLGASAIGLSGMVGYTRKRKKEERDE